MGKNERQAYLKAIRTRYRRARKKAKITILDEFCSVCGYNRKYAIRLLNQRSRARKQRRPGPKAVYASSELLVALKLRPVLLNDLVKQGCVGSMAHVNSCGVLLCKVVFFVLHNGC
jgi:hypothetical protein